jgi:hypothetical protein
MWKSSHTGRALYVLILTLRSFDAGQEAFIRYSRLFNRNNIPFVRSDVSARVVASANNWTAGFASASHDVFQPKLTVILGSTGVSFSYTLMNISDLTCIFMIRKTTHSTIHSAPLLVTP